MDACRSLGLILFLVATPLVAQPTQPSGKEAELVREVYVPHEELLRLAARDPSGVVMTLREYRALLREARANTPEPEPTKDIAPLEATAVYQDLTILELSE